MPSSAINELRRRVALDPRGTRPSVSVEKQPVGRGEKYDDDKVSHNKFRFTDLLRVLAGLALLSCVLSYFIVGDSFTWGYRPWWTRPRQVRNWMGGTIYLTDAELAAYDGTDPSKPIYVALNGTIYDVTVGRSFYGPGGSYGFFAGKDATRAYITGCFKEDLTPDIRGVEEMFIPKDDPTDDKTLSTGKLKTRRERETRLAKQKVHDAVAHWGKLFTGASGKNYFKVGEVVREEGWLEKLPKRELCQLAQNKRKQRKRLGHHHHDGDGHHH